MKNILLGISIIVLMIAGLFNGMTRLTTANDVVVDISDDRLDGIGLQDAQANNTHEAIKSKIKKLDEQLARLQAEIAEELQTEDTKEHQKLDYTMMATAMKLIGSYKSSEMEKIVEINQLVSDISLELRTRIYHSNCYEDFLTAKNKYDTLAPYYRIEMSNILETKDYLLWKYSYEQTMINLLKERVLIKELIELLKNEISIEQQNELYLSSEMIVQSYELDIFDFYKESKDELLKEVYTALGNNVINFIKVSGLDINKQERLQKKVESLVVMVYGTLAFEKLSFKNNLSRMRKNYEQGQCQLEPVW